MAQWGTPEYAAEMHRQQQQRDLQFRQQQEANKRFADAQAARTAEQARQKAAQDRTSAFMAGARGDTYSHHKFSNYSSFISGSAAAGRDPATGKSFFEKTQKPPQQSTSPNLSPSSANGLAIGIVFVVGAVLLASLIGGTTTTNLKPVSKNNAHTASQKISLKPYTHYVTAGRLNIRKGPGTQYKILGGHSQGVCIKVVGNAKGAWAKVAVQTTAGPRVYFAHSKYLRRLRPSQTCS